MNADELRKSFLDFFAERGHRIVAGSSLIPEDDPSLLFTGAGMNQFKHFLLGSKKSDIPRVANCQKCFRTTDIENVGYTVRHLTFLEMLGNFSFGDYFKNDAIAWAWEFVTSVLRLPQEKLRVSVFRDDNEAYLIWKKIGIPETKIVRLGEKDNFWSMGPTGPCGPCSEIIFDRGEEKGCGQKSCGPGCGCDRFLELWNLVFTQFNRTSNGNLTPLPQKNIDTGMGLERALFLLEGSEVIFECSLLKPILNSIAETLKIGTKAQRHKGTKKDKTEGAALWIMADHLRAATFLIGDGVSPANDGRGYVLRRLLRRAVRQAHLLLGQKKLSLDKPFLYTSAVIVANLMKSVYPELTSRREYITQVIFSEEERFLRTLEQGMEILLKVIDESKKGKKNEIPAEVAFKMHDTYGFPIDLTEEIARENSLTINRDKFNEQVRKQQERARLDRESKAAPTFEIIEKEKLNKIKSTEFLGYKTLECRVKVLAIVREGKLISSALKGDKVEIILDKTPFYPESGGQVGDVGILCRGETKIEVIDTRESGEKDGIIIHQGIVVQGKIGLQEQFNALVNEEARQAAACNHTATHLLQNVLRQTLGEHITQLGSFVSPERLRFDFNHFKKIDERQLNYIEKIINKKIRENKKIAVNYTTFKDAKAEGAIALFEEKYEESVRVVKIGDYSYELCGGTHVKATGEIGIFHIVGESSIAAGTRRIEAVSGKAAWQMLRDESQLLREVGQILKSPSTEVRDKVESLLKQIRALEKEINLSRKKEMRKEVEKLLKEAKIVNDIKIISSQFKEATSEELRSMVDVLGKKVNKGVIVLGSDVGEKAFLVARVTENLIKEGFHAGNIIKEVAGIVGGSGGGRPDYAQAGGKNTARLSDALLKVPQIVVSHAKRND
ncbi:MAG: Alanine--tRNA ligase [Syntrophomonadaceae bacterium]|nr:Alanine--tRNA ligase [Bacillota bacterium]